jgi:hypothetical protein
MKKVLQGGIGTESSTEMATYRPLKVYEGSSAGIRTDDYIGITTSRR